MMIVGIVSGAQAQTELTVSYGAYTQMDAMDCHDGGPSVNNAWGAINAGLNFHVAPGFWLGPSYTFSSTSRKHYDENKFYYHAIMLNLRYDYYRNSIVTLYAKGALGSVIMHETWPDDSKNKGILRIPDQSSLRSGRAEPFCGHVRRARLRRPGPYTVRLQDWPLTCLFNPIIIKA